MSSQVLSMKNMFAEEIEIFHICFALKYHLCLLHFFNISYTHILISNGRVYTFKGISHKVIITFKDGFKAVITRGYEHYKIAYTLFNCIIILL